MRAVCLAVYGAGMTICVAVPAFFVFSLLAFNTAARDAAASPGPLAARLKAFKASYVESCLRFLVLPSRWLCAPPAATVVRWLIRSPQVSLKNLVLESSHLVVELGTEVRVGLDCAVLRARGAEIAGSGREGQVSGAEYTTGRRVFNHGIFDCGLNRLAISTKPSNKAAGSNRARFGLNVLGFMKIVGENLNGAREPVDQP